MHEALAPQIDAQLINELSPGLFRFARRFVRRPEEAADLVQETWLSALRGAQRYEGRSSFSTWLNGILRRRAADLRRKDRPTCSFEDALDAGHEVPFAAMLDTASAASLASQLMVELTMLEQTAVTLCDLQDLDRDDAATQMGVTRGHLRVLLHRAHKKLADHLAAQGMAPDLVEVEQLADRAR